jgi:hypothetical protein
VARARGAAAHLAVMEAEEVKALAPFPQVDDPRLGLLRAQPEFGQQRPQRREGTAGVSLGATHHDQIVGVRDTPRRK